MANTNAAKGNLKALPMIASCPPLTITSEIALNPRSVRTIASAQVIDAEKPMTIARRLVEFLFEIPFSLFRTYDLEIQKVPIPIKIPDK